MIYENAMAFNQAKEWAETIKQGMDSLIQHRTWDLIPISDIEPGHCLLKDKWVYRI